MAIQLLEVVRSGDYFNYQVINGVCPRQDIFCVLSVERRSSPQPYHLPDLLTSCPSTFQSVLCRQALSSSANLDGY